MNSIGSGGLCTLMVLAGLPACGGKSDSDGAAATGGTSGTGGTRGSGAAGSLAESEVQPTLFAAACAALQSCCEREGLGYDPDACQVVEGALVMEGIFAGEQYDEGAAAACLEHIRTELAACRWIAYDGPCYAMFTGTLSAGATCAQDSDCAPVEKADVYCDEVCVVEPRGQLGDPCNASCTGMPNGPIGCGGPGGGPSDGLICLDYDGVYCERATFTCVATLDEGQPCESGQCGYGLYCDSQQPTPVCTPVSDGENNDMEAICQGGG